MAKKSAIERNKKRERLTKSAANRRAKLKETLHNRGCRRKNGSRQRWI
jgi:hypothetical protein